MLCRKLLGSERTLGGIVLVGISVTSKSSKAVVWNALVVVQKAFPSYRHKNSPKKFTTQQLFAFLVLKAFLRTDYRGVTAHLKDCPDLQETVGLSVVPHYTTIQKAAQRLLLLTPVQKLLDRTVHLQLQGCKRQRVRRQASCDRRFSLEKDGL